MIIGSTVKNMPGLSTMPSPGAADVNDIGLVVEQLAEPMAAEIAHHAHMLGLDEGLDRLADIAGRGAGLDRGDAAHHAFISDLDQPLGAARNLADRIHAADCRRANY